MVSMEMTLTMLSKAQLDNIGDHEDWRYIKGYNHNGGWYHPTFLKLNNQKTYSRPCQAYVHNSSKSLVFHAILTNVQTANFSEETHCSSLST
jgi:hypothetical protein